MIGTPAPNQPELLVAGEADEATPIESCRVTASMLKERGADLQFVVLPGAHHGFDVLRNTNQSIYVAREQTWRKCGIAYVDVDNLSYTFGGRTVTQKEYGELAGKCLDTGVTVRSDSSARQKAVDTVNAFVRKNFAM